MDQHPLRITKWNGWLTDEDLAWTQTSGINYDNSASPNSTLAAVYQSMLIKMMIV